MANAACRLSAAGRLPRTVAYDGATVAISTVDNAPGTTCNNAAGAGANTNAATGTRSMGAVHGAYCCTAATAWDTTSSPG